MTTTPFALTPEARFFAEPQQPRHRQYEALRAFFLEGLPSAEAARRFGYRPGAFRDLCWRFRHEIDRDAFFRDVERGPQAQPHKDLVRERVVALRKQNYSVDDIRDELERHGPGPLGSTAIQEILREEGFARLPRRPDDARPQRPVPAADAVADVRAFSLTPRTFTTHAGGLFLLLPLLARLDVDGLVAQCRLPGSKMIPATHAVRASLVLKLLGKSRRSHIMDLVFDPGVALAVGLNAVPKTTFMANYSARLGRKRIVQVLGGWVERLRQHRLIDATSFNLDFHSISYFGDDVVVEKHYVPRRSQRRTAVLTFLAQDASRQVFCYTNADLRKGEEADEILRFVSFWEKRYGERPKHLVFDSKVTTHANLSKLNALDIAFITLRSRSPKLMAEIAALPPSAWRRVELAVSRRKFRHPRVVEQRVQLAGYEGTLRQFLIVDLGHEEPTILLTNDRKATAKAIITRYARRMLIENGLADSVDFFHLDALSSAVALNVDYDVMLTVLASGIYRLFAQHLRGYEHAQARQIFRQFLDTTARVNIDEKTVTVRLPRRAHNPILLDAELLGVSAPIPWWGGRELRVVTQ